MITLANQTNLEKRGLEKEKNINERIVLHTEYFNVLADACNDQLSP